MPRTAERPVATTDRPSSFVSLLSGWVQQGVESFFATQRILVDLAMRQNTSAMNSIRKELSRDAAPVAEGEYCPKNILVEMAVEGTSNYIEAQRILLDLAQKENEIVLNGVGERVADLGPAKAMTNVLRRSIDTFVEMQQNFLTIASKHTQSWLESSVNGKDGADNSPFNLAGEAMKEFVATQKKFLDVVSEETHKTNGKKEHPVKKTALVELGREATDSFINAQKKLLDLAGQQMNANTQSLNRALDFKMPVRLMPMADIAGEGVRSFVDAEKALVNSMMKARNRVREEEPVIEVKKRAGRHPSAAAKPKARAAKPRARAAATA